MIKEKKDNQSQLNLAFNAAVNAMKKEAAQLQARGVAINPHSLGNAEQALQSFFDDRPPSRKEIEKYIDGLRNSPINRNDPRVGPIASGLYAGLAACKVG